MQNNSIMKIYLIHKAALFLSNLIPISMGVPGGGGGGGR